MCLTEKAYWGGCRSCFLTVRGVVWYGRENRFVRYEKDGAWHDHISDAGQLGMNLRMPTSLYEDQRHRIWFGTGTGVVCLAQGKSEYYPTTNDPGHASV